MVLNAHQRLGDCRRELDTGDFSAALNSASQLTDRLSHLAHAQARLGALADNRLLHMSDLSIGMKTQGGATVTSIERCPCGLDNCENKLITFDDGHQIHADPGWEIVVDVTGGDDVSDAG